MLHLGDIKKITASSAKLVNCVTFGSPCQGLSVAGKRAGLAEERSGLFMDAVRVIKEMRLNSFGMYPRFAVWENVPGAFSSNGGDDFRAVLEELARVKEAGVSIPRPEKGKWAKSGIISGDGYSIAWRTFDAQFWGVPQRRRRIAVVMDFAGQRAGEILFECEGLSGYSEPSIQTWKGIARNPANCVAGYDSVVGRQTAGGNQITACLYAAYGTKWNGNASTNTNAETYINISPTPTAQHDSAPVVFENHSQDARYTQQKDTCTTCVAQWGTGGNNMPLVAHPVRLRWIVRRLTPTECERLQGFPDGWTDIGEWVDEVGKKHKPADNPRYKALGNSIALPQWWWLTCKMAKYLTEHATLGSLFDGIGGFPLVWETYHGEGTAVWASEIEQFLIAVTKARFKNE